MASKNKNPYTVGKPYAQVFDLIRGTGNKGITRKDLVEAKVCGMAGITVVLSPRAEGLSTRGGDARGNLSSQGHLYFVEKRKKDGEAARFVLRWRKVPLEKAVRAPKKEIESQKAVKAVKAVKQEAEVTA